MCRVRYSVCSVKNTMCNMQSTMCSVQWSSEKHLYPHHVQKLWKVDRASAVLVHCIDQVLAKDKLTPAEASLLLSHLVTIINMLLNRPGVAGAACSVTESSFSSRSSKHHNSQSVLELGSWNFETVFTTPYMSQVTYHVLHVMCHMSCVTCHVSHVMCHMSHFT